MYRWPRINNNGGKGIKVHGKWFVRELCENMHLFIHSDVGVHGTLALCVCVGVDVDEFSQCCRGMGCGWLV